MFRSPFADGVVIIIILLLFFGPKQLPKLSRSIGESAKELKRGFASDSEDETADSAKTGSEGEASGSAKKPVEAKK